MSITDELADLRRDPDPIRRGRRATELLALYQQYSTELARLRREALEEAHRELGLSYSEIATALGITKGRVTQIRSSAPAAARALFGVGPVTIVTVSPRPAADEGHPDVDAEASAVVAAAERLLHSFDFATRVAQIGPEATALPDGDLFVICGPDFSPAVQRVVDSDPRLSVARDDAGWCVENRETHERYRSPLDLAHSGQGDVAYVARRKEGNRTVTSIAGLQMIGSLGAVAYFTANAAELYAAVGSQDFSLAVASAHNGIAITGSEAVDPPQPWMR